jgi:MarR family 2-MHQ and catechol resistance regulon transcriptional repressor
MGTKYRGSAAEVRALNAFIALLRAADAVTDSTHRDLGAYALTISQFAALEALHHCGDLCQGDLAGKLMRSYGSVTSLLDGLERRGLLTRRRSSDDKRFVTASLTPAGRRLVARIMPGHVRRIVKRFSVLTPLEQDRLRAIGRRLGRNDGR